MSKKLAWSSPRNWSLRVKFSVVLLVPLVLAVVLGALRIADQVGAASELDRVARFGTIHSDVTTLVEQAQLERFRATEFVAGGRIGDQTQLREAIAKVDELAETTRPSVESLYPDDPDLVGIHRTAEQSIARLHGLRLLVLGNSNAPASAVLLRYNELVNALVQLDNAVLRGVNSTEVNGLASALAGLGAARNETTLQEAQVVSILSGREARAAAAAELQGSDARLVTNLQSFRSALDQGQRVRYATLIAGPVNTERGRLVQGVLAGVATPAPTELYQRFLSELDRAEDGMRTELSGTSAERRQTAITMAGLNVVLLAIALVLGAALVLVIARGMIGSLRTLRRIAMDVAQERLPEAVARMRQGSVPNVNIRPVPVTTQEEVGQVARAFDAVHAQAVRLAAEQATLQNNVNAMFINLSRRSQALVDRQLVLIESLEQGEEDPEHLASLFRLDHLATRMRRNSENLLVLAGTELSKRAAQPLPVVEVLRAAVGEIEQYQRVVVQTPPDVAFYGRVAHDIQHLVAELLDNAATFSPPDTQVVVTTSRSADGSVLIEVFDDGIGLPREALAALNERLRMPTEASVAASRRMGLFVVGKLANRHGISVALHADGQEPTPGAVTRNGVTARVTIPAYLVHAESIIALAGARSGATEQAPTQANAVQPVPVPVVRPPLTPVPPLPAPTSAPTPAPQPAPAPAPQQPVAPMVAQTSTAEQMGPTTAEVPIVGGVEPPAMTTPMPVVPAAVPLPPQRTTADAPPFWEQPTSAQAVPQPGQQPGQQPQGEPQPPVQQPPVQQPVAFQQQPPPVPQGQQFQPSPFAPPQQFGQNLPPQKQPPQQPPQQWQSEQQTVAQPLPQPQPQPQFSPQPPVQEQVTAAHRAPEPVQQASPPVPPVPRPQPMQRPQQAQPQQAQQPPRPAPQVQPSPRPQPAPVEQPAESVWTLPPNRRSAQGGGQGGEQGPIPGVPPLPDIAPAESDPSRLFVAATPPPALPDPNAPRPADPFSGVEFDDPTPQPIFEEVSTGWFRAIPPADPATEALPVLAAAGRDGGLAGKARTDAGGAAKATDAGAEADAEETAGAAMSAAELAEAIAADFATPADSGWQAVQQAQVEAPVPELTTAGLPKRVPRARLLPGSAGNSAPPTKRDAEIVRGRWASLQRGVREGRETRSTTQTEWE